MDGEEAEETDLSHEQLVKNITKPYNQRKKFLCKGKIIHPVDVTTIRIIETEQPANEILGRIKATRGLWATFTFSDFQLLEEQGKDVTREYIQVDRRKQKKKKVVKKRFPSLRKEVFIVHGRDHNPMKELKAMLKKFGLNPIVLHEQPSGSRTIVEKLEKYSDVGYAFVILTPDDLSLSAAGRILQFEDGRYQMTEDIYARRARQNVILEFGYFVGKLGRDRVCCLHKGDVERPSDMSGIVYIPFKESVNEVRDKIVKELKAAGYEIEKVWKT